VHFKEDLPHWTVPGTMYMTGVYDHVIRATGFKYIDNRLFPEGPPKSGPKTKFASVSPIGESTLPDLFFIGASAANGDRRTTYGFISGFRYNVRTLFNLLEQRYHQIPYPSTEWKLETEDDLQALGDALISRLSTNSSLYTMWGALSDVLVFNGKKA